MTGNVIDYVTEYGDCPFAEQDFGDVDSLALCQLAYLKFDGFVPGVREYAPWVTLWEIAKKAEETGGLFAEDWFEKSNRALVKAMLSGRRFRNLRMNCYVNLIEKEWETQFSAITFLLENGMLYIAFRGTDESIVGWKEDFNMAFRHPVPGQLYSAKYLNMVFNRFRAPAYVGGHSKGGNLAEYGAMKCAPYALKNIVKIYNMDGPGFRPEILEEGAYHKIEDRVVKILPRSSLVGMIFEQDNRYQVVESKNLGVAQHNPYSWLVKEGDFIRVEAVRSGRKRRNKALNEWILSLSEEQLHVFVDTLYQVVTASQAEDMLEFAANLKTSMNRVLAALRDVDDQTARMIREMVKSLFEIAGPKRRFGFTPKPSPGLKGRNLLESERQSKQPELLPSERSV